MNADVFIEIYGIMTHIISYHSFLKEIIIFAFQWVVLIHCTVKMCLWFS